MELKQSKDSFRRRHWKLSDGILDVKEFTSTDYVFISTINVFVLQLHYGGYKWLRMRHKCKDCFGIAF